MSPKPFTSPAPDLRALKALVQHLHGGKSLQELVQAARFRRKRKSEVVK